MPYIPPDQRDKFDEGIISIVSALQTTLDDRGIVDVGQLNYVISSIIWELFDKKPSYKNGSSLRGALNDVIDEFYRRKVAPYEDTKIALNGDLL